MNIKRSLAGMLLLAGTLCVPVAAEEPPNVDAVLGELAKHEAGSHLLFPDKFFIQLTE